MMLRTMGFDVICGLTRSAETAAALHSWWADLVRPVPHVFRTSEL